MNSYDELIEVMKNNSKLICLVGEKFYIQLFIDYNLFEAQKLYIGDQNVLDFWADNIELKLLEKGKIYENIVTVY